MKVHHLNCGTMRPFGGGLVDGRGSPFRQAELVCHCLLLETDDGLVLVDSGLGLDDVRRPAETLAWGWRQMSRPALDENETAIRQVERLGFDPKDVRHVVLTHLDLDHGGGLRDFPHAEVHVLQEELENATRPNKRGNDAVRYPDKQWSHGPKWVTHQPYGESWFGFEGVREFREDILLVPLIGHTRGHTGIAVNTDSGWLLHAGDAYFYHGEMADPPHCTPALDFMQTRMEQVRTLRLTNQDRLRELKRNHDIDIINAHDATELRRHLA
ncbi:MULTISPECIES: MBL fold metallo-hydrolase [unclassified Saccharothrix]|uniref:MBL fold metallo-hydrolase n=1 Tax=unclassified Saccharothrix TaxID=2593673 RepID=UPI00307D7270